MLKPERVTFSADDEEFNQFANRDQLNSILDHSLVHYSTDFKRTEQQPPTSIRHSHSLDEFSSIAMTSQQQQQQQQQQEINHEPPTSAPPSLISDQTSLLNETNLHQLDALTLQQLAIGTSHYPSNRNEDDMKASSTHSTSLIEIQKEVDRVKQMKYGRTYSSPTSSLCSRLTTNPFNGSTSNIDVSSITHPINFNEQTSQINHLPFSSTYITSIPESVVPASNSSVTNEIHFIPINSIESPTIEDREVFETFHTKSSSMPGIAIRQQGNSLNLDMSTSETDIIASLHRSVSKQGLDNQSEHGTTYSGVSDDMIFVEWDKERSLFQDYINSLRTEIRVLLQERAEYQKQVETVNNNLSEHKRLNVAQISTDQNKLDLLQKSMAEKNLVLEQMQKEYENLKEKNSNLTRKISVLRCDAKSQSGVIDELKQKIAELTVDVQNHMLVKHRLEVSMMNLESDCKLIDAERLRLTNEIKSIQANRQDLEKLLQQANVQIAEQGSTIEMLRSDNIQVRSQLSATQRRMLQEKQQVMDYLRQIENDLVEKEQVKQREAILRKDFEKLQSTQQQSRQEIEQLTGKIRQDKQKLDQLEQERLQLLKTIENMDENKIQLESELNSYKSATKRLYTHFKLPFDSVQSIDQLLPMIEDRYRTEQAAQARIHHVQLVQSTSDSNSQRETEETRQLREELVAMDVRLKQLNEANQAWQQYQHNQLELLQERLKLDDITHLSFEDIVQQIENRLDDYHNEINELRNKTHVTNEIIHRSQDTQTDQNDEYYDEKLQNDPSSSIGHYENEIRELQENLAALTAQNTQLDEANRAWSQFHQTQLDSFRDKIQKSYRLDDIVTFDDIAQQVLDNLDKLKTERNLLKQQLQTAEKVNDELRTGAKDEAQRMKDNYDATINDLTQQVAIFKQQNDQLEIEKYALNQQLESQFLRYVKQERNTPTPDSTKGDSQLRRKSKRSSPIGEAQVHSISPVRASPSPAHDQQLQQLRDNLDLLTTRCAQLDEANQAWQLYHQTQFTTFVNLMHDVLSIDDSSSLDQAAQHIIEQIVKERDDFHQRYAVLQQENDSLRTESTTKLEELDQFYKNAIDKLNEELFTLKDQSQLRRDSTSSDDAQTTIASLTDELELTKQSQQTHLDSIRNQLASCLSTDSNSSLDELIQQIVEQVKTQKFDFDEKYQALERENEELRLESARNLESIRESYENTVNELNQELSVVKEAYAPADVEKQNMETTSSGPVQQSPAQISAGRESEEFRNLRDSFELLASQCAQLEEANRAWQTYQQSQGNVFRAKLVDYIPMGENQSFEEMAQVVVDYIVKERNEFQEKYAELERSGDIFRSEEETVGTRSDDQSISESITDLNQELATLKSQCEELEKANKQLLSEKGESNNPLEDRSIVVGHHSAADLSTIDEVTESHSLMFPIETDEMRQIRTDLDSMSSQLAEMNESNQNELDLFIAKVQSWIPLTPSSALNEIANQIHKHFEEQKEKMFQRTDSASQTPVAPENIHVAVETIRLTYDHHQTQTDPVQVAHQKIQTESFEQLLAESEERNMFNAEEDDERLRDYIDELSLVPIQDLPDRLHKECQQILSKQNLSPSSYTDQDLNYLALLTMHLLYNQHLTDDAKHLYNETLIRALKQEYELINNEKLDYIEKYHSLEDKLRQELNLNEKIYDKLQTKYDELLEQSELERLHSKKSIEDLSEQHSMREKQFEFNLFNLHQENEKLKQSIHQLEECQQKVSVKDYEQLRQDYDELINENELLKEYNSQMYQEKLQDNKENDVTTKKVLHDIEIQCYLVEEFRPTQTEGSVWNNDWEEEHTLRHPLTHELLLEKLSKDDEIKRLKAIILEMEHENSQKRQTTPQPTDTDSSTHDIGIHCSLQSPSTSSSAQAGMEHEVDSTIQTDLAESEENDWNSQMSTFEIASEADNMTTVTSEHPFKRTMDMETQTDEPAQEKLVQVNTKLKRALQTIKDKIHQAVFDQPELFSTASDDTIERLDHLIVTIGNQATQIEDFQNERLELLNKLQEAETLLHLSSQEKVDVVEYENRIRSLKSERDDLLERNKQLEDELQEIQLHGDAVSPEPRSSSDNSTQTAIIPEQLAEKEQQQTSPPESPKLKDRESLTFTDRVFGYLATSETVEVVNSETQTDELPQDKISQVNTKLKRALQTIKDKIYHMVIERPDLFTETNDDTIERLECLINTVRNQEAYIENLRAECDQAQREIDELKGLLRASQDELDYERSVRTEQLVSNSDDKNLSLIEDCQRQILQLHKKLSSNEDERTLLRERLNEVELELKKSTDNHESTIAMYEEQFATLVKERDQAVEENTMQLSEKLHEIQNLQEELNQLKESSAAAQVNQSSFEEEIKSLQEVIQQKSDELRDLTDRYQTLSPLLDAQNDWEKQKKEMQEQLMHCQNQVASLMRERSQLLEEVQKNTGESDKPTDAQQYEKLVKLNSKLKRALQAFKDKICRLVIARPDLFVNIGEETTERFDHLLYTVEHQATRIDLLQAELTESEELYRENIRKLQSSLEKYEKQSDYGQSGTQEHLVFPAPTTEHLTTTSTSPMKDYNKQIKKLRQKLTANENDQTELRQRLDEVELELKKTLDEHTAAIAKYEEQLQALVKERNAVIELHAIRSAESKNEIEHLQDELKQSPTAGLTDRASPADVKSLQDIIQQQSDELRDLSDRYLALSSYVESYDDFGRQKKEMNERIAEYVSQIEGLIQEREILVDEAEKNAILLAQIDDDKRSGDQNHEKLVKVNQKLKRALQSIRDKIHRVADERPEFFENVGDDTSERLDHLISFIDHQASQINALQSELDQSQEQYRDEIRELQNALEVFQTQIHRNHPSLKSEQPDHETTSPSEISTYISSSVFESEHHQQEISQLREKLSANEDERTLMRNRLTDVEQEFRKTLDECASTLSIYEQKIQSLVQERDGLIEQHTVQSAENQREIERLQNELSLSRQPAAQTHKPDDSVSARREMLEKQTKRRQDVSEKYMNLLSQLDSNIYLQTELDKLGRETEEHLMNYERQIESLVRERETLLDEKRKYTSSTVTTAENEKPVGDPQHEKLAKLNSKLKRALQTVKEKVQRVVLERPELFTNVGEETNERLDHLIQTVEKQATQIGLLQSDLETAEERLQEIIRQCNESVEFYRKEAAKERQSTPQESLTPTTVITRKVEPDHSERTQEIHSKQTSNDDQWNDWSSESIHCADERVQFRDADVQCELLVDRPPSIHEVSDSTENRPASVTSRLFGALRNIATSLSEEPSVNDWNDQHSPLQLPADGQEAQQLTRSPSSTNSLIHNIAHDLHQIVTENPDLFPHSSGDIADDLNQLILIIKNFQKEINELQNSVDKHQQSTEHVRPMTTAALQNPLLSSSVFEDHQREIDELKEKLHENGLTYQREIERLTEERNQATLNSSTAIQSQTDFNDNNSLIETRLSDCQCQIDVLLRERVALMEQIKHLAHQPTKQNVEIQTLNDQQPSTPSEQRISRRVFEQEMLAWSKESEQLKQFVKQIQVENKKLKDIILKFERLTHDYTQENERLKQENHHLALLSYSSVQSTDEGASSDTDICYLTLKWLTYEVAERTFDGSEPPSITVDSNDPYLKQRLIDTERHLKSIRIQNQKLKKQLETYTIQFKHIQHEMSVKNQELTLLKTEADRLRTSETQYRLEVDRLKADLQCDQVKIQQLEREIIDLKRETNQLDNYSTNNLRELLELKERELNALKEKLDYTMKAHQLELQEAIKANQFSLDNVQRFEQLDHQHQTKRKELETRLGKFCQIIRPLIDNQHLFRQNSIIDINELQRLIADTEAEEKVTNSLGAIRDCLGLLENQMKDLHHNLIENHARRSSKWKSTVGFECSSCDSQWEVTHDIENLQEACQDADLFLESSLVEPMSGCSCPLPVDLIESDVQLCLDDLLDDVIVRTTVK